MAILANILAAVGDSNDRPLRGGNCVGKSGCLIVQEEALRGCKLPPLRGAFKVLICLGVSAMVSH